MTLDVSQSVIHEDENLDFEEKLNSEKSDFLSDKKKQQEQFRKFVETISWSYHISISRIYNVQNHFRDKSHYQNIFRNIEYKLNKRYLKNNWSRWDYDRRFYFIGFKHGTPEMKDEHFHFLLHIPTKIYKKEFYLKNIGQQISMDFLIQSFDRFDKKVTSEVLSFFESENNSYIKVNPVYDRTINYHKRENLKQVYLDDKPFANIFRFVFE